MTVTLLQLTNAVLRRVGEIAGDSQELATSTVTSTATGLTATEAFTDSRRQHKIDVTLQIINETFHELYSMGLYAKGAATATMVLVAAQREYDLPSDFERMAGQEADVRVIRGATNGLILTEYPGGYAAMLRDQPVATDYTGQSGYYAFSPADNKLRLDAEPTSDEAGETYNYLYEKRIGFSSTMATTSLPCSDTVSDAVVPIVSEAYERWKKQELDADFLTTALNRALRYLSRTPRRDRYGVGGGF